MKKIFSEKNIVAILFLLVFIVFSFAHEDSKKRYSNYKASFPVISSNKSASAMLEVEKKPTTPVELPDLFNQK